MKTRIDFYVLASDDTYSRHLTACRLIEKAYRQGYKVYLRTPSADETRVLDNLLWTFRQGSFIPHDVFEGELENAETPVLLGHAGPPADLREVLVNLAAEVPPDFERFNRVAELVDQDEGVRQAGRSRYRQYQERGFEVQTHKLERAD